MMFTLLTGHLLLSPEQDAPAAIRIKPPQHSGILSEEDRVRFDALTIAAKAAALDRADRFQNIEEFRTDLSRTVSQYRDQIDRALRRG
jgi:hypothetical protein